MSLSINLIENHLKENQIEAISCFNVLITNHWNELEKNGSNNLIFYKLRNLLNFPNKEIANVLLECILNALSKYGNEYDNSTDELVPFTKHDDVFIQILTNIQMATKNSSREIHLQFLPRFINEMGITSIKHTKRLLQTLTDLLSESLTEQTVDQFECVICSMKNFITQTSMRSRQYLDVCLLSLLKLDYNIHDSGLCENSICKLTQLTCDCMKMLKQSGKDVFNHFSRDILSSHCKLSLSREIIQIMS